MSEQDDELGATITRPGAQAKGPREQLPPEPEGRYAVVDGRDLLLGKGGMGRVLNLVDTHLKREVAVKELLLEHTAERSSSGPLLENLFVREARVLALLEHPGVVPIYELGRRPDGTPYYSMRRIRGRALSAALEECVNLDERLALLSHFIDVVQTVGYAHSKGVIHRDLKPENVMVSRFGETQVIDWGLAVVGKEPPEGGILAGTPAYMAPEQAGDVAVDARSDVWALGVMLFELLTGERPFQADAPTKILDAVRTAPIPKVKSLEPKAPPSLVAVVEKALSRAPSERYQDAGAMADALEAAQRARVPRPVALMVSVGVLAVAALVLAGMVMGQRTEVEAMNRDARVAVTDARRVSADAQANAALAALRSGDTLLAKKTAEKAPEHPLARGVAWLAEERGVPERLWSVTVPAGCSAVSLQDGVAFCATLNGVAVFGPDGAPRGERSTGPTGWQRALLAAGGQSLRSGGDDGVLYLGGPGNELRAGPQLGAGIRALAYVPEERSVLTNRMADGYVAGLVDGRVLLEVDGKRTEVTTHPRRVTAVAYLGAGVVASVSEGLLRINGPSPLELDRHVGALAAMSATELAIGVERSVVRLRDGEVTRISDGHRDDVTALVVMPATQGAPARLVSGSADGTVRWWHDDGTLEGTLSGFEPGVQALAASADGKLLVATAQRKLEAWRLPPRARRSDATGVPSAHAWWPGGGLVSGYRDGKLRRVEPETGEQFDLEARHTAPVRGIARVFGKDRPEDLRFLSGGDDGRVLAQRWNGGVETLEALSGARIVAIAAARSGDRAAWAADDGTRVLWSLEFGKEIARTKDTLVRSLAFSHDGRTLAVGRDDKHVELVDAATGKSVRVFDPIDGAVTAVAFSADGVRLAAGSSDGRVTVWNANAAQVLHTWGQPIARVSTLDFHPDGKLLAAGSDDGKAWLFSPEDGALLGEIPGDSGDVLLVAFTESSLLVVGSDRVAHHLHP